MQSKTYSAESCIEKKLRFFEFELNPQDGGDESVNSSNSVSHPIKLERSRENEKSSKSEPDDKKFECQYCFKEFANS
ncbi:hypothetical protein DVH24_001715 [Malus domestica]|uniref:Uncharacterized protein n=1 Tax=Malus domestica TaxID=3750 RepID=A0A498I890_MALDO|nr:hypothetical protein DVH24_001715 [Malus domestica]